MHNEAFVQKCQENRKKKGINLKIQAGKKKKPGKLQKFKITTFWCMGY